MSELTWASARLRNEVAPVGTAQQVGARIRAAARALGWTYSRARDVWYADPRVDLKARELRRIEDYTGLRYGRQELTEIDALVAKADTLLAAGADEDFVGPFTAAVRAFARALDRARTGRRD